MIEPELQFIQAHKAAAGVAIAWIVRETPAVYVWVRDNLKVMYPYVSTHGGVFGLVHSFFFGQKPVVDTAEQKKV